MKVTVNSISAESLQMLTCTVPLKWQAKVISVERHALTTIGKSLEMADSVIQNVMMM